MIVPTQAGVDAFAINGAAMAGFNDWTQTLVPGYDQMAAPPPLMVTKVSHGVVYQVPPEPAFVVPEDETYAISAERG